MADNSLIILKNSSYAKGRKYIVDAEQLMTNFKILLESSGSVAITDIIESTGQVYNPLDTTQLLDAITQLILAANYFKDIGTMNNVVLDSYTPGYGVPTQYIHNMSVKFRPASANTGDTTLAFSGLSGVPILSDTYEQIAPGTLVPSNDYVAVYDENRGAFILTSTIEDSGSLALQEIRLLVESSGIPYSAALAQQLMQAVSLYAVQHSYQCVSNATNINLNNYVLQPYASFSQIPYYTEGMVLRFRPTFNNTLTNPTVQVYGMTKCPLVASDGDTLPVGSITTNFDVLVRYSNGSFYLVSNGLSSLKLQEGPVITKVSNDTSLSNSNVSSVPTEFAVKSYVDAKINSTKKYAVASGKSDSNGRANFFEKTDDSVLTILAGENGQPSYSTLVSLSNAVASPNRDPEEDPEEEGEYIYYTLANCFDGNNETFYETKDTGSTVSGIPDPMHEGQYLTWPNFVGATGLEENVQKVRLLGNDSTTLPRSVFFRYSIDGLPVYIDDGTGTQILNPNKEWLDVGTETYEEATPDGQIVVKIKRDVYPVEFNSGEFSNINVSITPYIDPVHQELGISYPYDVACYANEYTNTERGWQLVNFEFCKASEEIEPLVLTYANGTTEVVTNKAQLSTSDISGTSATVIKMYGGAFDIIDTANYIESYVEPIPVDNLHWVKLNSGNITTYTYDEVEDEDTQETEILRREEQYVKVGTVDLDGNGNIIGLHPAAFNAEYVESNISLTSPVVINHNIGSLNNAKMYIVCDGADGGYIKGDSIELTTQAISITPDLFSVNTSVGTTDITIDPVNIGGVDYSITYSPNPHSHTATSTVTTSSSASPAYRVVSSGYNVAILRYNNIVLPNKNNGNLFTINPLIWKLNVVCSRSF